ncbi:MAG: response regulator transcription factor [Deinococcota bacterium]|nr:response regulator transcription factor [Deinococcota bacterium]
MAEAIRVVLADDHPLVRSGLRTTLEGEEDVVVVGEATNGHEAQALCLQEEADVLLLDLSMPGPSALETITYLREHRPQLKVLIVSAYDDDAYVRALTKTGIGGYILKDEAAESVVHAIRAVRQGGTWLSQTVMRKLVEWRSSERTGADAFTLTPRERQLLKLLARGWDNARIALELNLADQTVRNYASRLYEKIGVNSRAEAIVWARKHGVTAD